MADKMNFLTLLNRAQYNEYENGLEFFTNDSVTMKDIGYQNDFLYHTDGTSIQLKNETLQYLWDVKQNQNTLLEAYNLAVNDSNAYSAKGDFGGSSYSVTVSTGITGTKLINFKNLTFKDIFESKAWFVKHYVMGNNINFKSPVHTDGALPEDVIFDFSGILSWIISSQNQPSKYCLQLLTGRKIYFDIEGLKYADTNQIVELKPHLFNEGKWVIREVVEEIVGSEPMTITDALNSINWDTQELVFKAGDVKEFIINKENYNTSINNVTFGKNNVINDNLNNFLVDANWTLRNRT